MPGATSSVLAPFVAMPLFLVRVEPTSDCKLRIRALLSLKPKEQRSFSVFSVFCFPDTHACMAYLLSYRDTSGGCFHGSM